MTDDQPAPGPVQHDLTTVTVPVGDLIAFHRNARRGDVDAIAKSLAELGQFRPIVVNKGTHTGRPMEVLAGNHTVKAAHLLKLATLDATIVDVDEATATKIVLADNRTADLATYDDEVLAALLESLGETNLEGTGYTIDDYETILDSQLLPPPMEIPTVGAGTGKAVATPSVQWGYIQWAATRVLISTEEVDALDLAFKGYSREKGTDVGFGFALAGAGLNLNELRTRALEQEAVDADARAAVEAEKAERAAARAAASAERAAKKPAAKKSAAKKTTSAAAKKAAEAQLRADAAAAAQAAAEVTE